MTEFGTLKKLERGEKALIICLGDSITEQNYHCHGRLNYVGQLTERLMEKYNRKTLVLNAGISGNTTRDLLERLDEDAIRYNPDMVTVMVGMNDATWGENGLPEFESNLREIASRLTNAGIETILITQNPIDFEISSNESRLSAYLPCVRIIRAVSAELGLPLCDIYGAWETYAAEVRAGHWTLMNDPIHPNEHGHDFIARTLFEFLGI